jgi:membrane protease YdiL (CAAX protease family)
MQHLAGDIAEIIGLIVTAIAVVGIVAFFSFWVHTADGKRGTQRGVALTMGLYIVFGAFGFFVLLYGLGSAYRNYLENEPVGTQSLLAIAIGVVTGLGLLPPLRRFVSKVVPFDPTSRADWVGFIVLSQIIVLSIASLAADNGEIGPVSLAYLLIQNAALVGIAFFLVGGLIYRTPGQTMQRLGLVRPSGRQVSIAIGLVAVLFVAAIASSLLVQAFQPELYDEINDNLGQMTEDIDSFPGALALGLASGTGEEILMRGAIQPRFGIPFTSVLFAVLHAQYGLSFVTAGVFVSGVIFGLERKYLNTTCCIITHALYNTIAVAITLVMRFS